MMGEPSDGLVMLGQEAFSQAQGRHIFHPSLLREYDIRGVVGETLHNADARAIGRGFAELLVSARGTRVVVARDGRHSSPDLEATLIDGLLDSGMIVERIGLGPTPMLYFAVHHLGATAGIMVTGSHNPPDQNGFKMVRGSSPVFGAELQKLGAIVARGFPPVGSGRLNEISVFGAYIDRLVRDYDGKRPLAVAWDAGNGATGDALVALVARLPGRHILLNEKIDGDFPAHHPDPTVPENLVQLRETVVAERCDLGIAFDGDGDRIGVVDGQGRILAGDQILMLLARDVLAQQPGSTVIADVKSSQALFDDIERCGGIPLMWKSGHALLRSKLAESRGALAGELSGHIFFADRFYGHDDALYAAVRFLAMAARAEESVAAMRDRLPVLFNTPELRFHCDEERKFAVIDRVKAHLETIGTRANLLDGVRVTTADGWWLLRPSNTQAMLVARCEATDQKGLKRVTQDLCDALEMAGITPPLFESSCRNQ
jgi:phosphomannomutase